MVRIPIGPFNWWYMTIPASISAGRSIHDLEFGVEYLDGILTGSENFGQLRKDCVGNEHELIGWARTVQPTLLHTRLQKEPCFMKTHGPIMDLFSIY